MEPPESIINIMRRFNDERRAEGDEVERITLRSIKQLEGMLIHKSESDESRALGIPVHFDEAIPENCGMLLTFCRHTPFELEADGGELMHMAKRHTVILRFGDDADRTREEE